MKLQVKKTGLVFRGKPETDFQSALYPDICALSSGRILVTFRTALRRLSTTNQHVVTCISDDKGEHWSEGMEFFPGTPYDHGRQGEFFSARIGAIGSDSALASLNWVDGSDTSRPYYNPDTGGILDHRIWLSRTDDNGETWTPAQPAKGYTLDRPTAVTSPPVRLPDKKLACIFEMHKHHEEKEGKYFSGDILFSSDEGNTWGDHAVISYDPEMRFYYWDQRVSVVGDFVMALFWSYDELTNEYLNIHMSRSFDNGHTWSKHHDTGVPGQPAQPAILPDGSIAMVYIDRTSAPAIKLRTSQDGGLTWPEDTELVIFDSAAAVQVGSKTDMASMWDEMYHFSVGFPSLCALPDGGLAAVWYTGPDTDNTGIYFAIVG